MIINISFENILIFLSNNGKINLLLFKIIIVESTKLNIFDISL